MNDLENYDRKKKLDKVRFFISDKIKENEILNIYFLKTINEEEDEKILLKLKSIIKTDKLFRLLFIKSQEPYNFDELDSEGIVYTVKCFYEIYLIRDKESNPYIGIIRENNYFNDGLNNELVYLRKIKKIHYQLFFLNRKQLYPIKP